MLSRLETMVLMGINLPLAAIRRQIASGVDIIFHLGRLRDKSRKVLQIVEILDYENDVVMDYDFIDRKLREKREESWNILKSYFDAAG